MACKCCGSTTFEHDLYLRVVSMDAASAKAFFGREDEPVDLGPADATRYKDGARVFGFVRPGAKSAEENARVKWRMS